MDDKDLDDIKEEIRRLCLASQVSGTDSATDRDLDERIRHLSRRLREEQARQTETLERLRAENWRVAERTRMYQEALVKLMQGIAEGFNRKHPPPPPGDRKT